MARVTVEDCLENTENRFELVLLATKRARQLAMTNVDALLDVENDKPTVIALREVAAGLIDEEFFLRKPESDHVMLGKHHDGNDDHSMHMGLSASHHLMGNSNNLGLLSSGLKSAVPPKKDTPIFQSKMARPSSAFTTNTSASEVNTTLSLGPAKKAEDQQSDELQSDNDTVEDSINNDATE